MIRTLAWKEYHEHRTVWIALFLLATVLTGSLFVAVNPPGSASLDHEKGQVLVLIACIVAATYGLVCGSMMLAGEWEGGTQSFLDAVTGQRKEVWKTKAVIGMALTLAQTGLVFAVLNIGLAFEAFHLETLSPSFFTWYAFSLFAFVALSWEAFMWGLLFSALCRNVLTASALTAVTLTALWVFLLPIGGIHPLLYFAIRPILAVGALWQSRRIFCRTDFDRHLWAEAVSQQPFWAKSMASWQALLWLTLCQARVILVTLGIAAPFLGFFLLKEPVAVWPLLTLLTGIVCGIGVFAGEQSGETYRFLGSQRLSPNRVWITKIAVWFIGAGGLGLLILLSGLIGAGVIPSWFPSSSLGSSQERELLFALFRWDLSIFDGFGPFVFLMLWVVYGFSFGQYSALVSRKGAVAFICAVLLSLVFLGLWLPSLIYGGLGMGQLLVVPLLFLVATRLVVWTWISNRISARKPVLVLAGAALLAAAWLGGSLWYRVAEVPDVGEPFDVQAFVASLPTPEQNQAGRLIRQAGVKFAEWEKQVSKELGPPKKRLVPPPAVGEFDPPHGAPGGAVTREGQPGPDEMPGAAGLASDLAFDSPPEQTYRDQVLHVLQYGWPKEDAEFSRWLLRMADDEWAQSLRDAAKLPVGVIDDPRFLTLAKIFVFQPYWEAANVLAAHALLLQARDQAEAGLDELVVVLALSRNLRHQAVVSSYFAGQVVERTALDALEQWRKKLGKHPELLRRALEEFSRHEAAVPPLSESVMADYVVFRNTLDDFPRAALDDIYMRLPRSLAMALYLGGQIPWERARLLRINNGFFACRLRAAQADYQQLVKSSWGWPRPGGGHPLGRNMLEETLPPAVGAEGFQVGIQLMHALGRQSRLISGHLYIKWKPSDTHNALRRLREVRLELARDLYQQQEGKQPKDLDDLVPRYLPQLPIDPLTGRPFSKQDVENAGPEAPPA